MGRDEKYKLALSLSFTLKMLIQGKQAGALQLLGIYSFLSWFLELRDRTSVGYTPFESALFVRLPNKPGNQYLYSKIKSGAKPDHREEAELGLALTNTPATGRILLKL